MFARDVCKRGVCVCPGTCLECLEEGLETVCVGATVRTVLAGPRPPHKLGLRVTSNVNVSNGYGLRRLHTFVFCVAPTLGISHARRYAALSTADLQKYELKFKVSHLRFKFIEFKSAMTVYSLDRFGALELFPSQ